MPVISLLTDFGTADHFAGVLHGVILAICPEARIATITHQVTPFDILEGAFLLDQAWRHFPPGSIHVAVVDPGVGSNRRPILARTGGHFFVAPDNGLLSMTFSEETEVRHITASSFLADRVSQTFHGRDIFAPVAAHLARGVPPEEFGEVVDDYLRLPIDRPVRTARRGWTGAVIKIDRFGNLITNFRAEEYAHITGQHFAMLVGLRSMGKLETSYSGATAGEPFVIAGSTGYLEVACFQSNAAKLLGCGVGAPVELRLL